jgi:hypothetical protein
VNRAAAATKALDRLARSFPPAPRKPTAVDWLEAECVWRAVHYWSDEGAEVVSWGRPDPRFPDDKLMRAGWKVRVRFDAKHGGDVVLTRTTALRGVRRLAQQAAALDDNERWIVTLWGKGVVATNPAEILAGFMSHGDDNVRDVICQYGAFGGVIFGRNGV